MNSQNHPRLTCYTSVFGNFEPVWSPFKPEHGVRFILVTENTGKTKGWSSHYVSLNDFDSVRLANRFQKMKFHESLPVDETSVYIDANIRPIASLHPLQSVFEESGADIGLYRHYSRTSVQSEAKACLRRGKVKDAHAVHRELNFYESEGFPDQGGLWEGSIIFKRHSSAKLRDAMQEWWELYSRFHTRDQFSLPYVIWKHQLAVCDLGEGASGLEKPFVHLQHSHSGPKSALARYLQARAPENWFWKQLHSAARSLDSI
jgi:hypothetical protein